VFWGARNGQFFRFFQKTSIFLTKNSIFKSATKWGQITVGIWQKHRKSFISDVFGKIKKKSSKILEI